MNLMDAQWLLWFGVALAAGVIEIFSLSLVFAMVAGGALAAALVAALTGSGIAAVMAFVLSTGLLLFVVRPPLLRYSGRLGAASATGVAALVGRSAEVLTPVTAREGQVKLAGEVWTARSSAGGNPLEAGSVVYVTQIDGATAVVSPLPPDPAGRPDGGRAALPGGDTSTDRPES
jgi:membrane protein implicated in regulation of membrane protease activity